MPAGLTDGLGWIKPIVLIMDDRAASKKMAYCRDQGTARPKSAEDAVAAVEPRRIDVLIASDINVRDEIIDEPCIHVASNGTARTKAVFLEHVATREGSFDLFEIDENHIRAFGETAVVAGTYRANVGAPWGGHVDANTAAHHHPARHNSGRYLWLLPTCPHV